MGKDVIIKEGDRSRSFENVNRLETDKKDGGVCYWVPEDERRLDTLFAFKNGVYLPDEGYYAFSDVQADVIDLGDVDITIDDLNVPHIDIDGIDITIDDIGMPEIEIDYHITTIDGETIKIACPDGKVLIVHGPDLAEPLIVDDVFKVEYDTVTGQWTITALTDCTSGGDKYAAGEAIKTWPASEDVDFHISTTLSFDLEDMGFDLDEDIDITIDDIDMDVDISGVDIDGLDIDLNIDLETLETDLFDLPDEIRIMHVPNKTSYQDGEEIDLDGLVVQAYRGGEVWEDKEEKYVDGYVPVHELSYYLGETTPCVVIYDNEGKQKIIPYLDSLSYYEQEKYSYFDFDGNYTAIVTRTYTIIPNGCEVRCFWSIAGRNDSDSVRIGPIITYKKKQSSKPLVHKTKVEKRTYVSGKTKTIESEERYELNNNFWELSSYNTHATQYNEENAVYYQAVQSFYSRDENEVRARITGPIVEKDVIDIVNTKYSYISEAPISDRLSRLARLLWEGTKYSEGVEVIISWPRPHDNKILTASFDITVEHPDDTNVEEP